ncbi:hypothetical protein AB0N28_03530 [Streptomyces sp. NPDC051130]|uniref:hypothetical protein n=1 Tax=Streptomyces sp. NPDC051130 TaxID=3157223 RepID=UPI00343BD50D
MADPDLTCSLYDGDRITARRATPEDGVRPSLAIEAFGDDEMMKDVYTDPDGARVFARSILALADEVDGGEAKRDTRPRVGDRLRVTQDNPRHCPVATGDVITVVATDYGGDGEDCVRFRMPGDDYWWFIPLSAVEPVDDAPTLDPSWLRYPTRLERLEAAKRLAPGGNVDDWLRIATYLEEN